MTSGRQTKHPRIHITNESVKALPLSLVGFDTFHDDELKGFAVRVTVWTKTYVAMRHIRATKRTVLYTLGHFPDMPASTARSLAVEALDRIAKGVDLNRLKGTGKKTWNGKKPGEPVFAPEPPHPRGIELEPEHFRPPGKLSLPKINASHFRMLTDDYGGQALAAKTLHITPELYQRWYTGQTDPPYHVVLALFWIGPWGFNRAFTDSHWTHQTNLFARKEAQQEVARLSSVLESIRLMLDPGHPALALLAPKLEEARAPALALPGGA